MQDLSSSTSLTGKMDSNGTNGASTRNETNDTESQGALGSFKKYLPIVKYVGSSTKDFFVSGQFKRTIRSPILFINPRHLSIPKTVGDALTRLAKNWGFYKSNYAIITFVCCFGWLFSSPSSLIVLSILFLIWWYTIKTSSSTLTIGEQKYGPVQKYMVSIVITLFAMLFFGIISTILGGLSVGAGISSLHAVCHIRPQTDDEQIRNLNDIEQDNNNTINSNTNNAILSAAANVDLNNLASDGNLKSFNGLEIMQMDDNDNESFSVNEINQTNNNNNNNNNNNGNDINSINNNSNISNNYNNYNNYNEYNDYNDYSNNNDNQQTSIFEKMVPNDDEPELGLQ